MAILRILLSISPGGAHFSKELQPFLFYSEGFENDFISSRRSDSPLEPMSMHSTCQQRRYCVAVGKEGTMFVLLTNCDFTVSFSHVYLFWRRPTVYEGKQLRTFNLDKCKN